MSVGAGILGRAVTLTVGGQPVAGVMSKSFSIDNAPVEVTDDTSDGHREIFAKAGQRSIDISISGVTKSLSLMRSALENNSQIYSLEFTWNDGSKLQVDGFMQNYKPSMEKDGAEIFEAQFLSSGEPTFTAGV
jgi:predicted secreted protein